jgi:acyl-CoA hydrolase
LKIKTQERDRNDLYFNPFLPAEKKIWRKMVLVHLSSNTAGAIFGGTTLRLVMKIGTLSRKSVFYNIVLGR